MKNLFITLISAVIVFCLFSCEQNDEMTSSDLKNNSSSTKMATLIKSDGSILYFDTYQDLVDSLKLTSDFPTSFSSTETFTKAITWDAEGSITFYKDTKYRDTKRAFKFYYPSQQIGMAIPDLSSIGMLNMISSLKLSLGEKTFGHSVYVTFWDQKNCNGYSITWNAQSGTNDVNVPDLTKIKRGGNPPHAPIGTWNDAAQSARFGFPQPII